MPLTTQEIRVLLNDVEDEIKALEEQGIKLETRDPAENLISTEIKEHLQGNKGQPGEFELLEQVIKTNLSNAKRSSNIVGDTQNTWWKANFGKDSAKVTINNNYNLMAYSLFNNMKTNTEYYERTIQPIFNDVQKQIKAPLNYVLVLLYYKQRLLNLVGNTSSKHNRAMIETLIKDIDLRILVAKYSVHVVGDAINYYACKEQLCRVNKVVHERKEITFSRQYEIGNKLTPLPDPIENERIYASNIGHNIMSIIAEYKNDTAGIFQWRSRLRFKDRRNAQIAALEFAATLGDPIEQRMIVTAVYRSLLQENSRGDQSRLQISRLQTYIENWLPEIKHNESVDNKSVDSEKLNKKLEKFFSNPHRNIQTQQMKMIEHYCSSAMTKEYAAFRKR